MRASSLASRSLQHGRPVVIEWGVYVDQNAINTLRRWQEAGAEAWWFESEPREAAREAWKLENVKAGRLFKAEKWHEVVNVITATWHLVEHFFGPDRILKYGWEQAKWPRPSR